MTNTQAILIGAAIIASAIIATNGITPAQAQRYTGGPYQLMQHSNTSANAGVFRVDASSGEVSFCFVPDGSGSSIVCTKGVK